MKASTKHDLMMVGVGAAVGAVALILAARMYPPIQAIIVPVGTLSKFPGFGMSGSVCPSCSTRAY